MPKMNFYPQIINPAFQSESQTISSFVAYTQRERSREAGGERQGGDLGLSYYINIYSSQNAARSQIILSLCALAFVALAA
jgi:hypothetical protein